MSTAASTPRFDTETLERIVARSTAASGVTFHVTDPAALRRIGALLSRPGQVTR